MLVRNSGFQQFATHWMDLCELYSASLTIQYSKISAEARASVLDPRPGSVSASHRIPAINAASPRLVIVGGELDLTSTSHNLVLDHHHRRHKLPLISCYIYLLRISLTCVVTCDFPLSRPETCIDSDTLLIAISAVIIALEIRSRASNPRPCTLGVRTEPAQAH